MNPDLISGSRIRIQSKIIKKNAEIRFNNGRHLARLVTIKAHIKQ
jgi:hypothetical protein